MCKIVDFNNKLIVFLIACFINLIKLIHYTKLIKIKIYGQKYNFEANKLII